jgi:hypothetical protein
MSGNPINQIPNHSGRVSEIEQIFRDKQRGLLPLRDYEILSAAWVSENLHEYQPAIYPPLSQDLKQYADARYDRLAEFDQLIGTRLGNWVSSVIQCLDQNSNDTEFLLWCKRKLEDAQLTDAIEKIDHQLRRFQRMILPGMFFKATQVLKMDAFARIAKNGG